MVTIANFQYYSLFVQSREAQAAPIRLPGSGSQAVMLQRGAFRYVGPKRDSVIFGPK